MIKPEIMNWITEGLRRRRAEAAVESANERERNSAIQRQNEIRDRQYKAEQQRRERERIEAEQRLLREDVGFQALRSIHVPEMLGQIKSRFWKKGHVVTMKDSNGNSYYGLQFVYKGIEQSFWKGTYYIDDVEAGDSLVQKDNQDLFDGIYVGIGGGHLWVKSINGGHFHPRRRDFYFTGKKPDEDYDLSGSARFLGSGRFSSQNELANLVPLIQRSLLDDALERGSNGRLPRTVAKVDWRSKSPRYGRLF